jgi:hypothetical protein
VRKIAKNGQESKKKCAEMFENVGEFFTPLRI